MTDSCTDHISESVYGISQLFSDIYLILTNLSGPDIFIA